MDAREVVAKALWDRLEVTFPGFTRLRWELGTQPARDARFADADAILAALAANQLAVVGREPTNEILSEIAGAYVIGAADRIAGNPQRATPTAREAWRAIFDAISPSPLSTGDRR